YSANTAGMPIDSMAATTMAETTVGRRLIRVILRSVSAWAGRPCHESGPARRGVRRSGQRSYRLPFRRSEVFLRREHVVSNPAFSIDGTPPTEDSIEYRLAHHGEIHAAVQLILSTRRGLAEEAQVLD